MPMNNTTESEALYDIDGNCICHDPACNFCNGIEPCDICDGECENPSVCPRNN